MVKYIVDIRNNLKVGMITVDKIPVGNTVVVLNDSNGNRMFGWELFKVTKRYQRLIHWSLLENGYERELKILKRLSTCIEKIMNDKIYIQLYYPLDDALNNKGGFTLIDQSITSHSVTFWMKTKAVLIAV